MPTCEFFAWTVASEITLDGDEIVQLLKVPRFFPLRRAARNFALRAGERLSGNGTQLGRLRAPEQLTRHTDA